MLCVQDCCNVLRRCTKFTFLAPGCKFILAHEEFYFDAFGNKFYVLRVVIFFFITSRFNQCEDFHPFWFLHFHSLHLRLFCTYFYRLPIKTWLIHNKYVLTTYIHASIGNTELMEYEFKFSKQSHVYVLWAFYTYNY